MAETQRQGAQLRFALRKARPGFDDFEREPLGGEKRPRIAAVEGAGQNEIGVELDDILAGAAVLRKRRGAIGEIGERGIAGIGAERGDLRGIGEGEKKLVRAEIDRGDAAGNCLRDRRRPDQGRGNHHQDGGNVAHARLACAGIDLSWDKNMPRADLPAAMRSGTRALPQVQIYQAGSTVIDMMRIWPAQRPVELSDLGLDLPAMIPAN